VDSVLLIISILLALLLVLLIVPVTLAFKVDRSKEIKGHVIFRWLFGVVRFRIGIPKTAKAKSQHKRKLREKTGKRKPGIKKVHAVLALLKHAPFRQRAMRFIRGILRAIHARDFYLRLRIGLDDPADTGRLWGLLGTVAGIAASLRSAEVRIEPEFTNPVLEVESHGEFRFIPLQFIGLATAFAMSPATLHAWFKLRRSNA
jgi:Protein of unknown function (DUF2953)